MKVWKSLSDLENITLLLDLDLIELWALWVIFVGNVVVLRQLRYCESWRSHCVQWQAMMSDFMS
jgi:hypothetical protein